MANNPALAVGSTAQQRQAAIQNLSTDKSSNPPAASPFSLSGSSDNLGGSTMSAFVSLSQLRTAAAQLEAAKINAAGLASTGGYKGNGYTSSFDIWAEVQSNVFHSNYGDKQNGFSNIAYFGADYLVHPAILIGALVQVDWTSASAATTGVGANGIGWMVGPYAAIKLTPQITFDARGAWGQSSNNVNPFGVASEAFETDRMLASARLTGNWRYGAWRINPEASLVYFSENQKAYTDPYGVFIPNQTVTLGRFTFGPEVGYLIKSQDGTSYEPYLGVKGVYDFSKQDGLAPDGSLSAPETFRGKVEAGLSYKTPSGFAVQGTVSYDGVGAKSFEDYQGHVSMRVPLN
jgi:outer membrane autotransporter protein